MERYDEFLSLYLPKYLKNPDINEIIISDENGKDIDKIEKQYPDNLKLRLYKNENQLGPFLNKLKACSYAKNEWIVLMDSDNFADIDYFSIVKEYLKENIKEEKNVILAPCFAKPKFNFMNLSGLIYKKNNFKKNREIERSTNPNNRIFAPSCTLMNDGNYVINKYLIDNIDLTNEQKNITQSSSCDVIYFNTLLFEQLDLNLHVVPNLEYIHVVHHGSTYLQTFRNYYHFNKEVQERYDRLI
jgi:hypothetical protein